MDMVCKIGRPSMGMACHRWGWLSAVFQNDAFDDVGGVFAAVDGGFDELEEFLPLDDVEGVGAAFKEFGDGGEVVVVADVFQAVDFDDFGLKVGELAGFAEEFDGFGESDGGLDEDFGLLDEGGLDGFDVVGGEAFGEGVDVVDDGVEFADEGVDVFAVEGGDEGAVEAVEGLVGELVGVVFFLADAGDFVHGVGEVGGEGS